MNWTKVPQVFRDYGGRPALLRLTLFPDPDEEVRGYPDDNETRLLPHSR